MLRRIAIATVPTALVAGLSGCAGAAAHRHDSGAPSPTVVTASIRHGRVSVSPRRLGPGPITLVVTNRTPRSQQITLESVPGRSGARLHVRQQTGPINPRDTASLDADVRAGAYSVHTARPAIRAGRLRVGAPHPAQEADLRLP